MRSSLRISTSILKVGKHPDCSRKSDEQICYCRSSSSVGAGGPSWSALDFEGVASVVVCMLGGGVGSGVETGEGFGAALLALAFLLTTFLFGVLLALFADRLTFFFGIGHHQH